MGRIKTILVKNIAEKVFNEHKNEFTNDFYKNKQLIKQYVDIKSKKMMNIVSGYVTRLKSREE